MTELSHALPGIAVVTVTYGDRVDLVTRCADATMTAGLGPTYVVCNGLSDAALSELGRELRAFGDGVTTLTFATNFGPGPAFAEGVRAALADGAEWILLLDDDNVVEEQTAQVLKAWVAEQGTTRTVGVCTRSVEKWQTLTIQHGRDETPRPGSFIYFDWRQRLRRAPTSQVTSSAIQIGMAPFGGMLVGRAVFAEVGLPRVDMTLYEEDSEYCSRLEEASVPMTLLANAQVHDISVRWSAGEHRRLGILDVNSAAERRFWLAMRNRVAVDVNRARGVAAKVALLMNAVSYVLVASGIGLMRGKRRSCRLLWSSVLAGVRRRPFERQPPAWVATGSLTLGRYRGERPTRTSRGAC